MAIAAQDSSQYASTMAFIGIQKGIPMHTLTLRPVPIFGMRWNHRFVAVTFASVLFFEWFLQVSSVGCIAPDITAWWYGVAFCLSGLAIGIAWYAHVTPNIAIVCLRVFQGRFGASCPRLNTGLTWLRQGMRNFWPSFIVTMVSYLLVFGLFYIAAALSGMSFNRFGGAVLALMSFACVSVPPLWIFYCYKPERFRFEADEDYVFGQPGRRDLEELSLALHKVVKTDRGYLWELAKQIFAPTRTMHSAIAGTRNQDRMQSGLTTFLLKRQLEQDQIMQILLIGYPIFGGWLVLIVAALLRSASAAALAFGALVLGALTAKFLVEVQQKLTKMMILTQEERESFPVWAARSFALSRKGAGQSSPKRQGTFFQASLPSRDDGPVYPIVSKIGAAVYGVMFAGFLALLSTSQLVPRDGGSSIGASVFWCPTSTESLAEKRRRIHLNFTISETR